MSRSRKIHSTKESKIRKYYIQIIYTSIIFQHVCATRGTDGIKVLKYRMSAHMIYYVLIYVIRNTALFLE